MGISFKTIVGLLTRGDGVGVTIGVGVVVGVWVVDGGALEHTVVYEFLDW
jgi:hypothetical protein